MFISIVGIGVGEDIKERLASGRQDAEIQGRLIRHFQDRKLEGKGEPILGTLIHNSPGLLHSANRSKPQGLACQLHCPKGQVLPIVRAQRRGESMERAKRNEVCRDGWYGSRLG